MAIARNILAFEFDYIIGVLMLFISVMPTYVLSECPTPIVGICECSGRSDQDLQLKCTGLADLPKIPPGVARLSIIDGTIRDIPAGYISSVSLTHVNLANNQLTTLAMESFEYAEMLGNIDLSGNAIECNENIDWLQLWRTVYPGNQVIGDCTAGGNISQYLADKPDELLVTSLGGNELMFGRDCEQLAIAVTVNHAASTPVTYRVTYFTEHGSDTDLRLDSDEVTIATGSTSGVILVDVVNGGSDGDEKSYLLSINPKYFTSLPAQAKIILEDGGTSCSTKEPEKSTTKSPSTLPGTPDPTTPAVTPPKHGISGGVIVIIILVIVLIILAIIAIIYFKFFKDEKNSDMSNPTVAVHYSPVSDKVYNPTTEEA